VFFLVCVRSGIHITLDNSFDDTASLLTDGSAGPVEGCSDVAVAV